MYKIYFLTFIFSTASFAAPVCFRGKINNELIDQVCLNNIEQVEHYSPVAGKDEITLKLYNVATTVVIFSSLKSFEKRLTHQ